MRVPCTLSRFQDVDIDNTAGVSLTTDIHVTGQLTLGAGGVLNQTSGLDLFYTAKMPVVAAGTYNVVNTHVFGNLTMTASLVLSQTTNHLIIDPGQSLTINGQSLTVGGDLTVTISDTASDGLLLINAADVVIVNGAATFTQVFNHSFATSTGNFTAGALKVRGNFTQTTPGGPTTSKVFVSTRTKMVFDGTAAQTVSFTTPGTALSRFQDVQIDNTAGGVTLTSNVAVTGAFTNNGGLEILSGNTLTVTSSGTFDNAAAGTLQGEGTLDVSAATFTNAGNVNPGASPGILSITGDYVQTSTGALNIEIGGLVAGTDFDQLAISGSATLAGTLNVSLINPFNPSQGNSFQIVNYASNSGTFDNTNLPSGFVWDITYGANAVTITVISTVITWDGGGDGSSWDDALNWDTDTLPGASDDVIIDDPGSITVIHSTGTTSINGLTCKENLTFSGGSLSIAAASTIDGTFTLSGPGLTLIAPLTLTQATSDLVINPGSVLTVNGQSLTVGGNLTVTISNTAGDGLLMTNAADVVTVNGAVTFTHVNNNDSATSEGNFTAGVLNVRGNFTQTNGGAVGGSPLQFFASTGTKVVFDGTAAQTVNFLNPGATISRFQDVEINNAAGVNFSSSAVASGTVTIFNGTVTSTAGTVTVGGDLVDAVGNRWQAMNTTFSGGAPSLPATLTTNATFSGGGVIANGFTLTGNLSVAAGGKLVMNGQTVTASGNLTVTISNTAGDGLIMTDGADVLIVNGDATFTHVNDNDAATSEGNFTAGVLNVRGNFTQTNGGAVGGSPLQFFASTGTRVVFDGSSAQTVDFGNPGASFSRFQDVDIDNTVGVDFTSDIYVTGQLTLGAGGILNQVGTLNLFYTAEMPIIAAGTYNVSNTHVFGNLTMTASLALSQNTNNLIIDPGTSLAVNGQSLTVGGVLTVTISNTAGDGLLMTNAADVVTVNGAVTFTHVNNNDSATSEGNFTAGVLNVRGNFTQTNGGSVGGSPLQFFASTGTKVVFDGTAAQTVNFGNPGSSLSRFQDVEINNAAGVSFSSSTVANGMVTILGGTATSTAGTVTVGGNLVDAVGNRWQAMNTTFSGGAPSLPATLTTNATFSGGGVIANGFTLTGNLSVAAGGKLVMNGQTVTASGNLTVTISNTAGDGLIMTDGADVLIVNGDATFTHVNDNDAATSEGNFTAGVLNVRGNFTQTNGGAVGGSPLQFFASTGTRVVFDGSSAQTVDFGNPGASFSRFQDVDIDNTVGVDFTSDIYVTGQLTLGTGGVLNQTGSLNLFYTAKMPIVAAGTYNVPNTRVSGNVSMTASLALPQATNDLIIDSGKSLTVNGQSLTVGGVLTVTISNTTGDGLIMTDPADVLIVNGDVAFTHVFDNDSATSDGNFTAGVLTVRGNFTQTNGGAVGGSPLQFFASTGTKVVFDGTSTQTVNFGNPGSSRSRFQDVEINNTVGGVTLTSDVVVTGQFTNNGVSQISSGKTLTVSGGAENTAGSNLQGAGTLNVSGTTFTNRGDVNPGTSPGILSITGDYVQDSTGALNIEIGGLVAGTDFDQLDISGTATLAGTLNVSLISSFKYLDKIKSILFSAIVRSSISDLSGLSRLAVG